MTLQEQEDREEEQDREDELARRLLEEQESKEAGSIGEGPDNFGDLEAMLNKYGEPQQQQLASLPPQTMTDAGGGFPARPNPNDGFSPNYRVPASLKSIPGLVQDDGSNPINTPINPSLENENYSRLYNVNNDKGLNFPPVPAPVPEPVWKTVPQVGGKTTQVGPSRFNPSKFKMPEDFNAPSEEYEDPTLDQTPSQNTDNKDANRQRLLAYLGMGTQDAITGMTGFKGDTNVYDQMLLAARQKNKDATNKQDKINNFLKQKNAWKIAVRKLEQGERFHKDKLEFDAWAEGEKNRRAAWEKSEDAKAKSEEPGVGLKTVDTEFGKDYVLWKGKAYGQDARTALADFKQIFNDLQTNPNLKPSMINNYLVAYGMFAPGKAEEEFPEIHAVMDTIESAVLPMLKATFGNQFTDAEGARLARTAFNSRLPPAANIKKLKSWITNMEAVIKEKDKSMNYYREHGYTLKDEPAKPRFTGTVKEKVTP